MSVRASIVTARPCVETRSGVAATRSSAGYRYIDIPDSRFCAVAHAFGSETTNVELPVSWSLRSTGTVMSSAERR
ncbi:hypothetical protein C495_08985 [Natronorubrum sulfidifaciens JCM 14089]|uniref:Uncharacterized protein n=1 Tax=Natronorubrum sulfidifaciens JCM 14089 TaxID=1230460 RepID=L9W6I7_9EURY|nr:hypothetical protein C495_08985 [Natronorubrum sulfidifaciens JCM 14089]